MSESDSERHDRIARRAYELYLARGRADGYHEDDWRQAEAEVAAENRSRSQQSPGSESEKLAQQDL
jgi:hypothetical protein